MEQYSKQPPRQLHDLYSSLTPLFWALRLLAVAPLPVPPTKQNMLSVVLNYFYSIFAAVVIPVAAVFRTMNYLELYGRPFVTSIPYFLSMFTSLTAAAVIFITAVKAQQLYRTLQCIQEIDTYLLTKLSRKYENDIDNLYRSIRKRANISMYILIAQCILIHLPLVEKFQITDVVYILFIPNVILLINVQLYIIVHIIIEHFTLLNKIMNDLNEMETSSNIGGFIKTNKQHAWNGNKIHPKAMNKMVDTFMVAPFEDKAHTTTLDFINSLAVISKSHNSCCSTLDGLNGSFSMQILLALNYIFVTIVCVVFVCYTHVSHGDAFAQRGTSTLLLVFVALSCVLQLFLMANAGQRLTATAKETGLILHNIPINMKDPLLFEMVAALSQQLLHMDVTLTACKLFTVDHSLIYSCAGAVTTYLVILIQFDITNIAS